MLVAGALVCPTLTPAVRADDRWIAAASAGAWSAAWAGELGPTSLRFVDGDHAVFASGTDRPRQAKTGDGNGSGPVATHDGYATFGEPDLLDHYDVRLVQSSRIEEIRPVVSRTVADTSGVSGQSIRLQPGTISNEGTGRGHIDIVLSSVSPCTGSWLACGGPTMDDGVVVAGRIWVHPKLLDHPTNEIDNTIRHELGHTLGLAHYSGTYLGRIQTMHPSRFDALRWEAGDRRGLRDLAGTGPAPVVVLDPLRYDRGVLEVAGHVEDAVAGTVLLLTIDGVTERWVMDRSNFRRSRSVGAGTHEVCAAIERDGRPDGTVCTSLVVGADPSGAIETVGSSPFGVEVVGWARDPQTPAPITVVVSVDGVVVEVVAQEAHDPATHPAHGAVHGFSVMVPAGPGEHAVCVTARNVGDGRDVALGCQVVVVSDLSIGRIGLQTI